MDNKLLPILIAKQKNAPILKDDYKLGWLYQDKKRIHMGCMGQQQ